VGDEVVISMATICMHYEYPWLNSALAMEKRWKVAVASPTSLRIFIENMRHVWEKESLVSLVIVYPKEIISEDLWEICWNFGIKFLENDMIDRWVLSIIYNVSFHQPEFLLSLVRLPQENDVKLSQAGCAICERMSNLVLNEETFLHNAAIGILMRITRFIPLELNGDLLRRIVEFVSSELADPIIRRLFFCQLSDCIGFWSQNLYYDGVEHDLNVIMEMLRDDPCMDNTLTDRWTYIMTNLFSGSCPNE
jgi:hypothetical protein